MNKSSGTNSVNQITECWISFVVCHALLLLIIISKLKKENSCPILHHICYELCGGCSEHQCWMNGYIFCDFQFSAKTVKFIIEVF